MKRNSLLLLLLLVNLTSFSQKAENGLEQFHSISGLFQSYDSENQLLNISCKDSTISFKISEYIIESEEYDSLLKCISTWESSKELINLELDYFAILSFNKNSQAIDIETFCKNINVCESINAECEVYKYDYDNSIKTLAGELVCVEVGDYLHITIKSKNEELHSFWVHYDIDEETKELLYSKIEMPLSEKVEIKYCNTVGYIIETGKPKLMKTCVDIIFK